MPGPSRGPGTQRLYRRRSYMWSPIFIRFSGIPFPWDSGQTYVGMQRVHTPLSGWSWDGLGATCTSQGTRSVTSGGHHKGIQGSISGPTYAVGPGRSHSKIDNDLSLGCNPSGTSPPSPPIPCSTSSRPGTMGIVAGGSGPTCPQALLWSALLHFSPPSTIPTAPTG